MASESVAQLVNQPGTEVPPVISEFADVQQGLDFIRVIDSSECITKELIQIPGLLGGGRIECLSTPDTQRFVFRRCLLASRAFKRGDVFLFGLVDFLTVQFPILPIRRITSESGDIAGGMLAATLSPLSILDQRLRSPLSGQPTGIRLSEIRRRAGFLDTRTVGRLLEHLQVATIAQLRAIGQLAPERSVGLLAIRVFDQPALDVRHTRDEVDRPLSGLPVDGDDKAGIRIGQILDLERFEFTTTKPGIELEGDGSLITRIATGIKQLLDVGIPTQHLGWIWHRIVGRGECGRDPGQRRRDAFDIRCSLAEHPKGNAIVLIRFRRVIQIVFAMNPPYQFLGGCLVFTAVDQANRAEFGHTNTMTEQLTMTVPTIGFTKHQHLIREFEQGITVAVRTTTITALDLLTQRVDSLLGSLGTRHAFIKFKCGIMKVRYTSHPWLLTFSSPSHRKVEVMG